MCLNVNIYKILYHGKKIKKKQRKSQRFKKYKNMGLTGLANLGKYVFFKFNYSMSFKYIRV